MGDSSLEMDHFYHELGPSNSDKYLLNLPPNEKVLSNCPQKKNFLPSCKHIMAAIFVVFVIAQAAYCITEISLMKNDLSGIRQTQHAEHSIDQLPNATTPSRAEFFRRLLMENSSLNFVQEKKRATFRKSCYILYDVNPLYPEGRSESSWKTASSTCRTLEGSLAVPLSHNELDFLGQMIRPHTSRVWINAKRSPDTVGETSGDGGGSEWMTGSGNDIESSLDVMWHPGEPMAGKDCASMKIGDHIYPSLYSFNCSMALPFICMFNQC